MAALTDGVAELLGCQKIAGRPLGIDGFCGDGYAVSTRGGDAALRPLLRTEGVLTDPVYTAKALHAVVERGAELAAGRPLVFWHTGGTPAVFSDEHAMMSW